MGVDQISELYEKSREKLRKEHNSLAEVIKQKIASAKKKALSKIR